MEDISYRRAEEKDVNILIDLRMKFITTLAGSHSLEKINKVKEHLKVYFEKILDKPQEGSWYIAFSGAKAIGIGGLVFREQPGKFKNPSGKSAYVMSMFTLPEFRRRGICREILKLLIEEAKKIGVTTFELQATKEGEFVYKQMGFEMHTEATYRMYLK